MADPIVAQTPSTNTNLNGDASATPTPVADSPVTKSLNIAPIAEPMIEQIVAPVPEETTIPGDSGLNIKPTVDQTIAPVSSTETAKAEDDAPLIFHIPEALAERNENAIQNPNVMEKLIAEKQNQETEQAPETQNDNRLQKEDQLIEQKNQIQEAKPEESVIAENIETPTETAAVSSETIVNAEPITTTEPIIVAPVAEPITTTIPAPSSDLQKDLQIIQDLQQAPTEKAPTVMETPITIEPKKDIPAPANSINLDSIANAIPVAPTLQKPNTPTVGTIPTAPEIPVNPYDHMQNYIPQIAPNGKGPKAQSKGSMIGIMVGVGFIFLAWIVIKTMYPIQYKSIVGGIMGTEDSGIATDITNTIDVLGSGDLGTGDLGTGASLETGNSILDDGLIDTGVLDGLSGTTHDSANTGSSEPSIMETAEETEFKTKLETYSTQGKTKATEAKVAGNKDVLKYSILLYKKADGYLEDIANGKEITTTDRESIISELSGYLNKIDPTLDAEVSTGPAQPEPQTDTGTPDFNPDDFFSNSGTSQP